MDLITAWLLPFIIAVAAPGRPQYIPEAVETKDEGTVRLSSVAEDIATVVWNEDERPIFKGGQGRARTAAVLLSIILYESSYRKDVDLGIGKHARGDGGRSWCLMQINIGKGTTRPYNTVMHRFALPACREGQEPCLAFQKTCPAGKPSCVASEKVCRSRQCDPTDEIRDGYTGPELVADRKLCIQEGLHILQTSLCTALPVNEWLRAYASGSCENGSHESQVRMGTAMAWFNRHRPQFTDVQVLALQHAGDSAPSLVMLEPKAPVETIR